MAESSAKASSASKREIIYGYDIFPLVFISDDKSEQDKITKEKFSLYRRLAIGDYAKSSIKHIVHNVACLVLHPSRQLTVTKLEQLMKGESGSANKKVAYMWDRFPSEYEYGVPAAWYSCENYVKFESSAIPIPLNSELILELYYGDWKALPPEEQRLGRHRVDVVDLDDSYLKYLKKGKKFTK